MTCVQAKITKKLHHTLFIITIIIRKKMLRVALHSIKVTKYSKEKKRIVFEIDHIFKAAYIHFPYRTNTNKPKQKYSIM